MKRLLLKLCGLALFLTGLSAPAQFTLELVPVEPVEAGTAELRATLEAGFYYQLESSGDLAAGFSPASGWMLGGVNPPPWTVHYATTPAGGGSGGTAAAGDIFSLYPFDAFKTLATWNDAAGTRYSALLAQDFTGLPPLLSIAGSETVPYLMLLVGSLAWDPAYELLTPGLLPPEQQATLARLTSRHAEIQAAVAGGAGGVGPPVEGEKQFFRLRRMEVDADGDGLDWALETFIFQTNPNAADSDNDGLNDGEEAGLGTNPNATDTDGDGTPDGAENAQGTDPNDVASFPVWLSHVTRWVVYSHVATTASEEQWGTTTLTDAGWDSELSETDDEAEEIAMIDMGGWLDAAIPFPPSLPTTPGLPSNPPMELSLAEGHARIWPPEDETSTELYSQARLSHSRFWITTQHPAPVATTHLVVKTVHHSLGSAAPTSHSEILSVILPAGQTHSAPLSATPAFTIEPEGRQSLSEFVSVDIGLPWAEMTWEAQTGFENVEDNKKVTAVDASDNPTTKEWMQGKGSRIFPDKKNPTDTTPNRNRCVLHIKSAPNLTVYLKAFDVDDATPDSVDNDPAHKLDPNGRAGDDNMDTVWARTGKFISCLSGTMLASNTSTATVTLNADGEANVVFETTQQPGDNFRVALAFRQGDLSASSPQVHNPSGSGFIAGDSDKKPGGFSGVVSPMLTVWRRLWCEFDSMETAPTSGSEMNFDEGYVRSVSEGGNTVALFTPLRDEANRFEDGRIYIADIGDYKVVSNTDRGDLIDDDVVVQGPVPANASGKQFWIYDDDYFPVAGNAPRTMPYQLSGGSLIYTAFADAFIEPIKVPPEYVQTNVPYKRNHDQSVPIVWQNFISFYKNVPSTEDLWSAHLLAAWQSRARGDDSDKDPYPSATQTWLLGLAQDWGNFGEIYVEPVREEEIYATEPRTQEQHTVVHEIGHEGGGDHDDGGLMTPGAPPRFLQQSLGKNDKFKPITIKRFRENRTY